MEITNKNIKNNLVTNNLCPLIHTLDKKSNLGTFISENQIDENGCPKDCSSILDYPNCICGMYKN